MDKNEITLQTYGKYSEQPKKTILLFKTELGIMENPFTKPRPGFTVLLSTKDYALTKHTVRLLPKKVRNTVK